MPTSACTPVPADEVLVSETGNPEVVPGVVRQDRNGAWVLLLPAPRAGQRILCLGLGSSDSRVPLQYWHDEVDVVQGSPASGLAVHTLVQAGHESGSTTLRWWPGQPLPLAPGTFDGVVIRLAGGGAVKHALLPDGRALASALLLEARRLLKTPGFVYLEIDNTWSVRNLGLLFRGKWGQLSVAPSRRSWLQALRAVGLPQREVHALLLERGLLAEILPSSGDVLSRQVVGFGEYLKMGLLGPRGAAHFATAYGVMAGAGDWPSLLDELLETVAISPGVSLPGAPTASFRAGRIISAPDKAFVECLPVNSGPELQSLFLVVPLTAETVARRRQELAALNQLKASSLPITSLLPATACEAHCRGRPVFIYSALPGRAIDMPVRQLPTLTQRAFDLLADFNHSSQEMLRIDSVQFVTIAGVALAGARGRYPEAHVALSRLEAGLERCLLGRLVRTAWMHGDFKVENLLFDMQTLRVSGVIDWELASPVGLLAVDLLYLLAYNRVTCGENVDVIDVIEHVLLPGRWTAPERGFLDRYVRAFAIPEPYMTVASAVFVIHHIGVRFTFASPAGPRQRLPTILETLVRGLEAVNPIGDSA